MTYYIIERRVRKGGIWIGQIRFDNSGKAHRQYDRMVEDIKSGRLSWEVEVRLKKVRETDLFREKI